MTLHISIKKKKIYALNCCISTQTYQTQKKPPPYSPMHVPRKTLLQMFCKYDFPAWFYTIIAFLKQREAQVGISGSVVCLWRAQEPGQEALFVANKK